MHIGIINDILAVNVSMIVYTMKTAQKGAAYTGYSAAFIDANRYYIAGSYKSTAHPFNQGFIFYVDR